MKKLNSILLDRAVEQAVTDFQLSNPQYFIGEYKNSVGEPCKSAIRVTKYLVGHVFMQLGMWEDVDRIDDANSQIY